MSMKTGTLLASRSLFVRAVSCVMARAFMIRLQTPARRHRTNGCSRWYRNRNCRADRAKVLQIATPRRCHRERDGRSPVEGRAASSMGPMAAHSWSVSSSRMIRGSGLGA